MVTAVETADRAMAEAFLNALGAPEEAAELVPLVTDDVMSALERAAALHGLEDVLERAHTSADSEPS